MPCESCRKRREAIKRMARKLLPARQAVPAAPPATTAARK